MNLTHKIALDPTCKQRQYFARCAGTARFVWNWALAEWNKQYDAGNRPSGVKLKKQFNATYREEFPWIRETHRDCHSQPFADLQRAFANMFDGRADNPSFKKKSKSRPSFCIANDRLTISSKTARLPVIGKVRMRESIRFQGKIMSARVVKDGERWFLCVAVDVGDYDKPRFEGSEGKVVGVDLGIKMLATLSTGEQVVNPKLLRKAQAKLRRAQRKLSRRQKGSNNRAKQARRVAKIHYRVKNIRHDGLHKLTTKLCRENQTVGIEDLNVAGMVQNHRLAQAVSDASFGLFRTLLTYKAAIYGTLVVVADRFYPSSKMCSACGVVKDKLSLGERTFECNNCGLKIDRDLNAALNLEKLARASREVTLVELLRSDAEAGTTPCLKSDA